MDNKKKIIIAVIIVAVIAIAAGIAVSVSVSNDDNKSSIVDKVVNEDKASETEDKAEKKEEKAEDKAEDKAEKKKEEKAEDKKSEEKSSNSNTADSKEQVKVTPTFMYFVSKSDADYDAAMKAVESLKKNYGEKVKFDIVDIDEKPEAKENFPLVNGQTPTLIMLNTSNDISNIKFKCSDEAELKSAVDGALE